MAAAEEIHRLQMREARRAQLAAVGLVSAVRDEIDAELALRRFDGGVNLAGRHVVALCVELEVVDQRFHRALHGVALRRHDLAVEVRHRAAAVLTEQAVQALAHDLRRLTHLLHADEVAVEAVAVLADRNVEFHLGIAFVRLRPCADPRPRPNRAPSTPEKPQAQASSSETTPMSTLRCSKMRLGVSRLSRSSSVFRNGSIQRPMSSSTWSGMSCVDAARPDIGRSACASR